MRLLSSKKGVTEAVIVGVVIAVIGAIIFLTVLWPAFSALLKGAAATGECNWNLFIATAIRKGSFGFLEVEPGCKAEYMTVDSELLKKYYTLAKKRITKYCPGVSIVGKAASTTQNYYSTAAQDFCPQQQVGYEELNEWAMDFIIAKKMQECTDKVWHGKLDFFAQEWGNRSVCVVCSVISFSDDLPVTLKTKEIESLYDLLNAEPYYKTTYYNYISDWQTIKPTKPMYYYKTDKPLAVTFMHTKDGYWEGVVLGAVGAPVLGGIFTGILTGYMLDAPDSTKQLMVLPYEDLRKACTDIIA
ncbi:hypothetical protein KY319_02870 [Candidatus Woesearchaeota archaeon]|nr:hypothetical protein [Candidatus Woesearchaeota archaeon]